MIVIELFVTAVQTPPLETKSCRSVAEAEKTAHDYAIGTFVLTFQVLIIMLPKRIGRLHV